MGNGDLHISMRMTAVFEACGHDEISRMDILPEGVNSGSAGRILLALEMTLEISVIRNKT
jgi:hypothetical protein